MSSDLGYAPGPMGWVIPGIEQQPQKMLDAEKRAYDIAQADFPIAYRAREAKDFISPEIEAAWKKFQADRGRFEGSSDLTLIDEFLFGKSLTWLPQDIGSCVWSNTFRRWFERMCVEIGLLGNAEEFIGKNEFGPLSLAPFCVSYGFARKRGNMRGGDGLYRTVMSESLMKDGVILCSTPKLKELLQQSGATTDTNYPEVRSASLYRKIGDWAWNDALLPFTDCRLLEGPKVETYEQFCANEDALKPMFMCSAIAIKKAGTHKDGFTIHTRNRLDRWDHNMGLPGRRVASDGARFHRVCNTSWLQPGTADKEAYIYNIAASEMESWFKQGIIDVGTIGEIDGIKSLPASI